MNWAAVRVFLAAPFSQWRDDGTGEVGEPWRTRIENMRSYLLDEGYEVFNAHHNEAWGKCALSPSQCTQVDFQAMRRADLVCAIVGSPPSSGVAVELGWASAFGKPVLAIVEEHGRPSPLILGLEAVADVQYLIDDGSWDGPFMSSALSILKRLNSPENSDTTETAEGFVGSARRQPA